MTEPEAVPPGDLLRDELTERGMTQTELAERIGRPVKVVNEIVNHRARLTPETALQLEAVFGVSAETWLMLEARYRLALARAATRPKGKPRG